MGSLFWTPTFSGLYSKTLLWEGAFNKAKYLERLRGRKCKYIELSAPLFFFPSECPGLCHALLDRALFSLLLYTVDLNNFKVYFESRKG